MKKLLLTLIVSVVFGFSTFAKSFVVLTDDESVAYYSRNAKVENDTIKGFFADGVVDFPKSEWKNYTQIVVFDKTGCIYNIWVNTYDSKAFGISITSFNGSPNGECKVYHCDTIKKVDPLQIGLNFMGRKVLQVYSVDDNEIVYNTYEVEIETETESEAEVD